MNIFICLTIDEYKWLWLIPIRPRTQNCPPTVIMRYVVETGGSGRDGFGEKGRHGIDGRWRGSGSVRPQALCYLELIRKR